MALDEFTGRVREGDRLPEDRRVSVGAPLASSRPRRWTPPTPGVVRVASIAFCGVLPAVFFVAVVWDLAHSNSAAVDFAQFYHGAQAILDGRNPYAPDGRPLPAWGSPYPYPPLPALAALPLTAFTLHTAKMIVMVALALAILPVLALLDVRDWRCYGVVLVWPPVISAIQTGNVTIWFALAVAITWRYRDRVLPAAVPLAVTLAAKFFLWPLSVWLAATRRWIAAVLSAVLGAVLLVLSWAVIGFAGFHDYPALLHRLDQTVGADSYTIYNLGIELGLPSAVSRAIWLGVGLALLAAVVVLARRGDERRAFILGIAAALSLTPIVWLHYFALLAVVVALARPRLGLVWFVPFAFLLTRGSGHHSLFQLVVALLAAGVTIGLALRDVEDAAETAPIASLDPVLGTAR